jgi:YaiO family outer membrane protein
VTEVLEVLLRVITGLNVLVLGYFVFLNGGYLLTTILAMTSLRRHANRAERADVTDVLTSGAPPITLLAPAYNEEATCVEATTALLSLVYPEYEVLVVNDGSKDRTLERMKEAFELEAVPRAPGADISTTRVREIYRSRRRPNLWVIDKENGGKADALNVGINYCRTELFCAMDADTLLERDALARVVRPFLEDARTMATGGIIRIVNDSKVRLGQVEQVRLPRNFLARVQVLEYLRAFLAGRVGWDVINAMLIISGAFGLFRRTLVVQLGGYATDTVGEDMELVVRIHRHCLENRIPYRVSFVPDPVAWTECPESVRVLGRQRDRWQRGLMQVLWRHRVMLFNPKYGRVGMIAFPFFFFLEGWGPLIEIAGYISFALALILGSWSPIIAVAFFVVAFVFGAALSIAAVGLEELSFRRYERWSDLARLLLVGLLEPFGYRQLSTWWRTRGVISALRGVQGWGVMERRGFKTAASLLLVGSMAGTLGAQQTPWTARVGYARETFESNPSAWTPWETTELSVARRFSKGALGAGIQRIKRFDITDDALFVDAYRRAWSGAYVNVRAQAPMESRVTAPDVGIELYQGFGTGWEASAGYRLMFFDPTVRIVAASLGRFVGPWFARARLTHAGMSGSGQPIDNTISISGLVRRQLDDSQGYLEASAGSGGEAVLTGPSTGAPTADVRRTAFVSVGGQKFVSRTFGIAASAGTVSFDGAPRRIGVSLALLARW